MKVRGRVYGLRPDPKDYYCFLIKTEADLIAIAKAVELANSVFSHIETKQRECTIDPPRLPRITIDSVSS